MNSLHGEGFQKLNFILPEYFQPSSAILTLTGNEPTNLGDLSNIGFSANGNSNVKVGDTINLVTNNSNTIVLNSDVNANYNTKLSRGVTFDHDFSVAVSEDGHHLTGQIGAHSGPKPETENIAQSVIANVEAINSGSHNLLNNFDNQFGLNISEDEDGFFLEGVEPVHEIRGFQIFGGFAYGKIKTKTNNGGFVRSENKNYDLGLGRSYDFGSLGWTIAPTIEHGYGNYDVLLSNGVKGYGKTDYTAGGFITRATNKNGYYFEISARLGKSNNDFASNDFISANGENIQATYHADAPVFAGHTRIGQKKRIDRNNLLDVYGIYAYSRQGDSDTQLSTGESYKFSSINSSRLRLGYRLTTRTSRISKIFTGLAYQYDHTSDSETRAFDGEQFVTLPSVGSKGSSGMIEIGWQVSPKNGGLWLVDMNTTGWFGHQKGVITTAKIQKSF